MSEDLLTLASTCQIQAHISQRYGLGMPSATRRFLLLLSAAHLPSIFARAFLPEAAIFLDAAYSFLTGRAMLTTIHFFTSDDVSTADLGLSQSLEHQPPSPSLLLPP